MSDQALYSVQIYDAGTTKTIEIRASSYEEALKTVEASMNSGRVLAVVKRKEH